MADHLKWSDWEEGSFTQCGVQIAEQQVGSGQREQPDGEQATRGDKIEQQRPRSVKFAWHGGRIDGVTRSPGDAKARSERRRSHVPCAVSAERDASRVEDMARRVLGCLTSDSHNVYDSLRQSTTGCRLQSRAPRALNGGLTLSSFACLVIRAAPGRGAKRV